MILGGAVLGTVVATFEGVDGVAVGALRVPRSLVPLWALGLGAVAGFPLDEVWHRAYGVDVTMWSPTHMLMILGATFTGMAAWLVLAGSGVRPTDGPWGRGAHVVCGWLTVQGLLAPMGEFTFGVPQFSLLFAPILVSMAAGLGLLAFRLVHGRWWTLGLVAVNFAIQASGSFGGDENPVTTRFSATFLASARRGGAGGPRARHDQPDAPRGGLRPGHRHHRSGGGVGVEPGRLAGLVRGAAARGRRARHDRRGGRRGPGRDASPVPSTASATPAPSPRSGWRWPRSRASR